MNPSKIGEKGLNKQAEIQNKPSNIQKNNKIKDSEDLSREPRESNSSNINRIKDKTSSGSQKTTNK